MKAKDLREKSTADLIETEKELRQELFKLKMHLYTGQLESVAELKNTKRSIARVLTLLKERDLAGAQA